MLVVCGHVTYILLIILYTTYVYMCIEHVRSDTGFLIMKFIIVKYLIFDTNIFTLWFSDNYNLTTEDTEKHRACIWFTLCDLCGLLIITCWNLHFISQYCLVFNYNHISLVFYSIAIPSLKNWSNQWITKSLQNYFRMIKY